MIPETVADVRDMLNSPPAEQPQPPEPAINQIDEATSQSTDNSNAGSGVVDLDALPAGFPGADDLIATGHTTVDAVAYLRDTGGLTTIKGIGGKTAEDIIAALDEIGA